MKKLFHHFYQFTEEEYKILWQNCNFALDANVLLNLYRYSDATAHELLALLEPISARIIVPYQFALEFQRRRISVITDQVKNYREAENTLKRF